MKPILILKTGELPRRVIEYAGSYEQAFFKVLGEERCVVVDARKESLPDPDWGGIIVTGSPASANDGDAWISHSKDFLKRAADRSIPLYGVCFGHQLVARTFGGTIEKCERGWELGTATVSLTQAGKNDALFATVPESFLAQQSHGEVVAELPPGAIALAHNDHCAHQAFKLGDHIWGTQFHPEFTPAIVEGLISSLASALPPESFPRRPAAQPLRDWLLATVREAQAAQRCLDNFVAIIKDRSGA